MDYRWCGASPSSAGGSANLTTLGVCATASPPQPPCTTPLPGGFLPEFCLLHPPQCTPLKIDKNASLAPGLGGGPLPPSGGGPACAPVPRSGSVPLCPGPSPPPRAAAAPSPHHPAGGGPVATPPVATPACPTVREGARVSLARAGRVSRRPEEAPRAPPSDGGPVSPVPRAHNWLPAPGSPGTHRPVSRWPSFPGSTVGSPPRVFPCPHVPHGIPPDPVV